MREKISSTGTLISMSLLALLLVAHALLIFPGWEALGAAAHSLIRWLRSYKVTVADCIALVSALATVSAVLVALWLARGEQRRIDKESNARAQLAAASIATRLTDTLAWVQDAWGSAVFLDNQLSRRDGVLKGVVRTVAALQKPVSAPDRDTLLNLTPLPNGCAHRIARAFGYIERLQGQAAQFPVVKIKIYEKTTSQDREALLESWRSTLSVTRDLLRVAIAECNSATELGAPIPTAQEIHGDQVEWDE